MTLGSPKPQTHPGSGCLGWDFIISAYRRCSVSSTPTPDKQGFWKVRFNQIFRVPVGESRTLVLFACFWDRILVLCCSLMLLGQDLFLSPSPLPCFPQWLSTCPCRTWLIQSKAPSHQPGTGHHPAAWPPPPWGRGEPHQTSAFYHKIEAIVQK